MKEKEMGYAKSLEDAAVLFCHAAIFAGRGDAALAEASFSEAASLVREGRPRSGALSDVADIAEAQIRRMEKAGDYGTTVAAQAPALGKFLMERSARA